MDPPEQVSCFYLLTEAEPPSETPCFFNQNDSMDKLTRAGFMLLPADGSTAPFRNTTFL
jgi:hypothetical protein